MSVGMSGVGAMSRGAEAASVAAPAKSLGSFAEQGVAQADRFIPSLNKDIFANTSPVTVFADFQDRPVSLASLKDMVTIATNQNNLPEKPIVAAKEIVVFESTQAPKLESYQLKARSSYLAELKMASNIYSQLLETGVSKEEAKRVAEQALAQAIARKNLVKTKKEEEEEEKTEAVEVDETEEKEKQKPLEKERPAPDFVRDEYADEARRKDGARAIDTVFDKGEETASEDVKGSEIVENMSPAPTEAEVSELALRHGQKFDGSYTEILDEMKKTSFKSKREARERLEQLILEKPAVTTGKSRSVGEDDVRRVLRFKNFRNPVLDFITKVVKDSV